LSRLVTARSRRPARAPSRRSTRRLLLSQRGVPHFPLGRRRLDPAKPRGARSTASTIARAAGAGVTLMRPADVAVTSRPPARHRRPEGSVTAARSAHHYRRRPRDHYRATSLLRLFAEPDDNTTKRTILMTNGRKTRQRRQDQRPVAARRTITVPGTTIPASPFPPGSHPRKRQDPRRLARRAARTRQDRAGRVAGRIPPAGGGKDHSRRGNS
jgi:hypothetical protein